MGRQPERRAEAMKTIWTHVARGYARWAKYVTGMEGAEAPIASSGVSFQLWRLYQHFWLLCLFFPLAALLRAPISPWHFVLGLFALLFFAASYTWLMWPHPVSWGARARTQSRIAFLLFIA